MAQRHLIEICNLLTKLGQTCESKLIRNLTEFKKSWDRNTLILIIVLVL